MFCRNFSQIFLVLLCVFCANCKLEVNYSPPHCTQVSKNSTDYAYQFRLDYPTVYIIPGQKEAYQKLYCINPPAVKLEVTMVCDWTAPPQVEFTLGDEYMHVVRQDPTGRFLGNAVITTYQFCQHNHLVTDNEVNVMELDDHNYSAIIV